MERFDAYVYAQHVSVETDHKPLLAIHRKALSSAPKRLQRMLLRLQRYSYDLIYRPGSTLVVADALSRAYDPSNATLTQFTEELASLAEQQIIDLRLVASDKTINNVRKAAADDAVYSMLIEQIRAGWPEDAKAVPHDIRAYSTFSDDCVRWISFQGAQASHTERHARGNSVATTRQPHGRWFLRTQST